MMPPFKKTLQPLLLLMIVAGSSLAPVEKSRSQSPTDETFTVQLKDVELFSLIETVSKRTGKNFIIDPRVKARVTLISSQPVNKSELYELFLSILEVHGYATVPAGEFIKIVPMSVGVRSAVPVIEEKTAAADELITEVIAVDNIPAQQLIEVLRPLLPQTASLHAEPSSNTMIITDRAANIARLKKIVRTLDQAHRY